MAELFEKRRVRTHIHGGKLKLDAKTEMRRWQLNIQIALEPADVHACHEAIISNYQQIEARENGVDKIELGLSLSDQVIDLFGLEDHKAPVLRISRAVITDLRMTHDDGVTQLEFKAESECSHALHDFIRDYAFTTIWAEYEPMQRPLPLVVEAAKPVEAAALPKSAIN